MKVGVEEAETETNKDPGVYVGVEDEQSTEEEDDGLGDAWMEMSMAIESSKVLFRFFLYISGLM